MYITIGTLILYTSGTNKRHRGEHRRITSQYLEGSWRCTPQAVKRSLRVVTHSTHWPRIPDITHVLTNIQRTNTTHFVIVNFWKFRRTRRFKSSPCYFIQVVILRKYRAETRSD